MLEREAPKILRLIRGLKFVQLLGPVIIKLAEDTLDCLPALILISRTETAGQKPAQRRLGTKQPQAGALKQAEAAGALQHLAQPVKGQRR
jgi:hypothetical protein